LTKIPSCPDCRVAMETGFLLDRTNDYAHPSAWVEGAPEPSFWAGTKTRGKERHPVASWRCPHCGLLRLYATATAG
jgi:hypothetical protein